MSAFSDTPLAAKVAEAKERLPLPRLMERRGLAAHAKRSAFCPFHENTRTPAFSVFQDERRLWRWKCLSQCGHGDEITFLEKLDGLSNKEATRQFLAAAGVEGGSGPCALVARAFTPSPRLPATARAKPSLPPMEEGNEAEVGQLANLRGVSPAALLIAQSVGLLRFATLRGHRAWIVTDDARVNAQARRLDGGTWTHLDGAKAWTLAGCWASWPIGIELLSLEETPPMILLVEGGPDLLASLHFIHATGGACRWLPCAMLGAKQRIHEDALPYFAGRRVHIFPHDDEPGRAGAEGWARQLATVGADVDCFRFAGLRKADGSPIGDLNDCTSIHPDDAAELEGLLP